jgi:integrase
MDRILREVEKLNPFMKPLCEFALETAMRRGELLSLNWMNIDFIKRTAHLKITKNGSSRFVPLSTEAINILNKMPRDISGKIFPLKANTVSMGFIKAVRRGLILKIFTFTICDIWHLRGRLSSKFTNILELAAISGHKELKMLQRLCSY